MEDAQFLADVADRLPPRVGADITVSEVRLDRERPWLRVEVRFEVRGTCGLWTGAAFVPFDAEWRYLSGYERVDNYVSLLASEVLSEAYEVRRPAPPPVAALGPPEVASRWQWLLERLALDGRVVERGDGSVDVVRPGGGVFTVIITPEEWAPIAEPLDIESDDPQDFNQWVDDERFLVFHEGALEWSIRAELPPVPFGGAIRRSMAEARERGDDMSQYGWFANSGERWDPDVVD